MAVTAEDWQRSYDDRISRIVEEAARRVPGMRARLDAAGLEPVDVADVAALDRLPVLTKDDLLALQREAPPFGGMLADDARPRRVFQSPGPLYEPEFASDDGASWAPALAAAGFGPGDLVLVCFGYHLSPAGTMFEKAALAIGAAVVPGGVGNKDLQVAACLDLGVTAYIGPPSYLKALCETAAEAGTPLSLDRALVAAEPFPPSLRTWLADRVAVVRQAYGTAECGLLGFECEATEGLHVPPDGVLVQVCDLTTGAAVHDGTQGQVVVTRFTTDYPVIRFGTGDLSSWLLDPCPCGRPGPRLAGWQGRVGDAVKVRGMFLHPAQLAAVLGGLPGVAAWRVEVDREDHLDVVRCQVVPANGAVPGLANRVRGALRDGLRFNADVQIVPHLPADATPFQDLRSWD